jgi:hypothetical protein
MAAGIDLGFDESSAHATVEIDAALMAEAINNLLDNALKYCPPQTRVTVAVRLLPEPTVIVEDTGRGIAPAERSRVVQRFYRGDKRHRRRDRPRPCDRARDRPGAFRSVRDHRHAGRRRALRDPAAGGLTLQFALFSADPAVTLLSFVARFALRHWSAYASAGAMLVVIAVLTVFIPRRVGHIIDGLVGGRLAGAALWQELAILLAMAATIYFLRVGWRLQLFSAAFRLGVELRTELYRRLSLQGPTFFHRRRTGDLMANATNDVDAVEMAAGEAFLAGFDGTLTLVWWSR